MAHIRDGQYKVENCPVGPAKIAVSTTANADPMQRMKGKMKRPPEIQEKLKGSAPADGSSSSPTDASKVSLPPRYQDSEKSGLSYTVKGGSQAYDIDISDK